ncbi:MAG: hypothetical protein U9P70_04305 [Patescibacteria group bacterium]|nr:hypothetical protein [Patescibacteria group bacterium]
MEPTEQILHLDSTAQSLPRAAMRGDYRANINNIKVRANFKQNQYLHKDNKR